MINYSRCTRCCTTPLCNDYDDAHFYEPNSDENVDHFHTGSQIKAADSNSSIKHIGLDKMQLVSMTLYALTVYTVYIW